MGAHLLGTSAVHAILLVHSVRTLLALAQPAKILIISTARIQLVFRHVLIQLILHLQLKHVNYAPLHVRHAS